MCAQNLLAMGVELPPGGTMLGQGQSTQSTRTPPLHYITYQLLLMTFGTNLVIGTMLGQAESTQSILLHHYLPTTVNAIW